MVESLVKTRVCNFIKKAIRPRPKHLTCKIPSPHSKINLHLQKKISNVKRISVESLEIALSFRVNKDRVNSNVTNLSQSR